ncbi:MAG: hypothetical protein R3293_24195 [Candidatus Promineifilaceae bacterium]|nr:hypothetical protein [Candidatus Promineifilaceae bacterium]
MMELATIFEPRLLFFLFLLFTLGVLLFTVYSVYSRHVKSRKSKSRLEAKIKWQRRIEAIREAECE